MGSLFAEQLLRRVVVGVVVAAVAAIARLTSGLLPARLTSGLLPACYIPKCCASLLGWMEGRMDDEMDNETDGWKERPPRDII
jgi:hypothetical protein